MRVKFSSTKSIGIDGYILAGDNWLPTDIVDAVAAHIGRKRRATCVLNRCGTAGTTAHYICDLLDYTPEKNGPHHVLANGFVFIEL